MPVRKVQGGWVAYPGGPKHKTKAEAQRQLRAIEAAKAKRGKR